MCKVMEIQRGAVPSNIAIEFERDASLRAVEIIIINHDRDGEERQAVKLIAQDNGTFYAVSEAVDLVDGVDIVPLVQTRYRTPEARGVLGLLLRLWRVGR